MIRTDYRKRGWWTISEAAAEAGVCENTIRKWMRVCPNGRERFVFRRHSSCIYRIDAHTYLTYLLTGEPQGRKR